MVFRSSTNAGTRRFLPERGPLHLPLGHLAAFFSLIPFYNWKKSLHGAPSQGGRGWQDVGSDHRGHSSRRPHSGTAPERTLRETSAGSNWIPLFSVLYRCEQFLELGRDLRQLFCEGERKRAASLH